MKNVAIRFENYQKKRPNVSTLVNFAAAIKSTGFTHDTIRRWFNVLVDKEDYGGIPKIDLMRWLDGLANPSRRPRKRGDSSISNLSTEPDGD